MELMPPELITHQQDMIQDVWGTARTLCPGTHASGPHLTKTLVPIYSDNNDSTECGN